MARSSTSSSRLIVVMGVAGCGKSTVGAALAGRLHKPFLDADDFHPPANIEKMSHGVPLSDEDRWPWLDRLGQELHAAADRDGMAVCACSALRRAYRERMIAAAGEPILFVYLKGTREIIAGRMSARTDHFMPTALLDSQFATLEPPGDDELSLSVDIGPSVTTVAETIHSHLTSRGDTP